MSHWLAEALQAEGPDVHTPRLAGSQRCDICVVGGGYLGLWTAIRLKQRVPSLEVSIVEKDLCGAGASGRNGGFALSWWPKIETLTKAFGPSDARALVLQSEDAIQEISRFCTQHAIDAHIRNEGWLWTATSERHLDGWSSTVTAAAGMDPPRFREVSAEELYEKTGSREHLAGVLEACAATLQPALLVRGLRRVALELGVAIYERSPMTRLTPGPTPVVSTDHGTMRADRVVLATNAWLASDPALARKLVVIGSDMGVLRQCPDRLEEVGWTHGIGISDSKLLLNYHRRTRDGRIAFGKALGQLAFGGRVGERYNGASPRAEPLVEAFRALYPKLRDIEVESTWHGPIDRSYDGLPFFGPLGDDPTVLVGAGFSGNGVAPTVLGGQVLASLALDSDDQWARNPLVRPAPGAFPPEPLRYVGGHLVRRASAHKDKRDDENRPLSRAGRFLLSFSPPGLTPIAGQSEDDSK